MPRQPCGACNSSSAATARNASCCSGSVRPGATRPSPSAGPTIPLTMTSSCAPCRPTTIFCSSDLREQARRAWRCNILSGRPSRLPATTQEPARWPVSGRTCCSWPTPTVPLTRYAACSQTTASTSCASATSTPATGATATICSTTPWSNMASWQRSRARYSTHRSSSAPHRPCSAAATSLA